ncbi:MAG: hypothetical protein JKY80_03605 [Mariprofundaceae bacterium]|nr:hypothetical protein [Mariprofundaceae bacterium]
MKLQLLIMIILILTGCAVEQSGKVMSYEVNSSGITNKTELSNYFESKVMLPDTQVMAHLIVTLGDERLPKGYKSPLSGTDREYQDQIDEVEEIYFINKSPENVVIDNITLSFFGSTHPFSEGPVTIQPGKFSFIKTKPVIGTTSLYRAARKRILKLTVNGKPVQVTMDEVRTPVKRISPKGFKWFNSQLGASSFLIPEGWFIKEEVNKGHYALFISKEEIKDGRDFKTGFSLNFNTNVTKKTGSKPSDYAKGWVSEFQKSMNKEIIEKPWHFESNGFKGFGIKSKDAEIIMHNMLIANDKSDSLYITLFEAPAEQWTKAWKIGNVIMNNLRLDKSL